MAARKNTIQTEATKLKISIKLKGNKNPLGHKRSAESRLKDKEVKLGYKNPMFGKRPHNKDKPCDRWVGEGNPNWKGGVTPINLVIRTSLKYKIWRRSVFKRDDYTCQLCGVVGGELNADHIKPFALFPKLRFSVNNGRTLCRKCHTKTSTFGYRTLINK